MLAAGVHRAHHDLVAQDKFQIDAVSRHLNHAVSAGDAGKYEHTILAKRLHAVEHNTGVAGGLKNQVKGPKFLPTFDDRHLLCNQISRTNGFDKVGIQIRFGIAGKGGHLNTAQPESQRCQQADGACAHYGGAAGTPNFQPALDFIRLVNTFFDDRHWLEQHAYLLQPLRHLHDKFDIIHVMLRQKAVT